MGGFFESKGVKVYDTTTISFNQLYRKPVTTCTDCNCPEGYALYLQVAHKDVPTLEAMGFVPARVDPLNPDSYVGSRQAALSPELAKPREQAAAKPTKKRPARRKRRRS